LALDIKITAQVIIVSATVAINIVTRSSTNVNPNLLLTFSFIAYHLYLTIKRGDDYYHFLA